MFSVTSHSFVRASLVTLTTLAILQTAAAQLGPAYPVAYCSTLNTGSTPINSSVYQSEGLCHDFCLDQDYALAVLNYKDCWCSDYFPGTTTSTGSCDTPCPGYKTDLCGGTGLYGYIALNKSPLGSQGAVGTTTPVTSQEVPPVTGTESQSGSVITVFHTVTADPSTPADPTTSPATTAAPTDSGVKTDSSSSSTWTATPVVSVYTVTGAVHTVTFTPTSPPSSANTDVTASDSHSGLSVGQAVGLTVGLVALFAVISGLVFCCIRKKRREAASYESTSNRGSSSGMNGPTRSMSQSSRYMLSTDGKQVVEGWGGDDETTASGTKRSRLMPVDPRLDPFAPVYQRGDGNKSRDSVATIRDDHDYSRRVLGQNAVLRATNPDLEG